MSARRLSLAGLLGLAVLVLASTMFAFAAANAVPATGASEDVRPILANDLKPAACAAIAVQNLVTGDGAFSGTNRRDLLLGGAGVDSVRGNAGADCILGGGSDDLLRGDAGQDVCIGGPGVDSFISCETAIQ